MSFANYRFTESEGKRQYTRGHAVSLVGRNGLIAEFVRSLEPSTRDQVTWELSGPDISRLACPDCKNPDKELLLDLYPEGLVDVCLHRVERIVGVSSDDWTDAILVTRPVLNDTGLSNAAEVKKEFSVDLPFASRENMEAFGIKGGYEKGSYSWTKPKMNIGAAVCGGSAEAPTRPLDLKLEPVASGCSGHGQSEHACTCGTH